MVESAQRGALKGPALVVVAGGALPGLNLVAVSSAAVCEVNTLV